jgi:cytoskeletal protein RodZ
MEEQLQETTASQPLSIGEQLQTARTAKSIDISSVATDTRIKISFLEALENNDFKALPNLVTARGFMKVYADYLGLPLQPMIDQFNALFPEACTPHQGNEIKVGLEVDQRELFPANMKNMNYSSRGAYSRSNPGASKQKQLILGIIGVIVFLIGLNLYFKSSMESLTNVPRQATDLVTLNAKLTPEAQQQTTDTKKAFITLEALNKTYIQVIIDGRMFFRGNVAKGDVKTWQGDQYIKIKAEVPRNIQLFVNGRDVGLMSDQMTMLEKTYFPGDTPATTNETTEKATETKITPVVSTTVKTVVVPTAPTPEVKPTVAMEEKPEDKPVTTAPKDEGVYGF